MKGFCLIPNSKAAHENKPAMNQSGDGHDKPIVRRSSSSSSRLIVRQTTSTTRTTTTATTTNFDDDNHLPGNDDGANLERGSRQANYVSGNNNNDNNNSSRTFSRADKLPSSSSSSAWLLDASSSMNQVHSYNEAAQLLDKTRTSNNNNNNCPSLPEKHQTILESTGKTGNISIDDMPAKNCISTNKSQTPNWGVNNVGQQQGRAANVIDDDDDHDHNNYSLLDTADLQSPQSQLNSSNRNAVNQTMRADFYDNLLGQDKDAESQQVYSSKGMAANQNVHLISMEHQTTNPTLIDATANQTIRPIVRTRGSTKAIARRSQSEEPLAVKSATLPPNTPSRDRPRDLNKNKFDQQQAVANGRAIRDDLLTSMQSPQRSSIRLAAQKDCDVITETATMPSDYSSLRHEEPLNSIDRSASNRGASRSTLSAVQAPRSRVGKFVNYYPSTRQPQGSSTSSPSHKRHTSPYAFHVPLYRQQALQQTRAKSPISPRYERYLYESPPNSFGPRQAWPGSSQAACLYDDQYFANHDQQNYGDNQEGDQDTAMAMPEIKQARYGYVAPLDRLESKVSLDKYQQQKLPISKFNNSLRSRTIGHIPNMVQVSVDDNMWPTTKQASTRLLAYSANHQPMISANHCTNRSEGDLLKAHRIAWRHSNKYDLGHDNPFKPGTELSLEADLMVRLIKRGYPIEELPNLVQATKEVLAHQNDSRLRSKSCDRFNNTEEITTIGKSEKSGGYLSSNLRHVGETNLNDVKNKSSAVAINTVIRPQFKSHSNLLKAQNRSKKEEQNNGQLDELESCKRIWANSLSRAKSLPRFNCTNKENSKTNTNRLLTSAPQTDDTDSLDKLITNIESEISDLLVADVDKCDKKTAPSKLPISSSFENGNEFSVISGATKKPRLHKQDSTQESVEAIKRRSAKYDTTNQDEYRSPKGTNNRMNKLTSTTPRPALDNDRVASKSDLKNSKSSDLLLTSDVQTSVVSIKKRSKCCLIQ